MKQIKAGVFGGGVHFLLPARKKSDEKHQFKMGDSLSITLNTGRIVAGYGQRIVEKTDGARLQVDYGKHETALLALWRVRPKSKSWRRDKDNVKTCLG